MVDSEDEFLDMGVEECLNDDDNGDGLEEEEEDERSEQCNDDVCAVCHAPGTLVCCDK